MQIYYDDDGEKTLLDGKFLKSCVVRTDLVPIPVTVEAEIRVDSSTKHFFEQGSTIYTSNQDEFVIIKSEEITSDKVQVKDLAQSMKIIAVLSSVVDAAYVKEKSIKKDKTTLTNIYRIIGCKLKKIVGDFTVPTFCCLAGDPPTFQIAMILQESGGVICWREGELHFIALRDLFSQEVLTDIPIVSAQNVQNGFMERHEIPSFYSINEAGEFIYGNREKARTARFIANKDEVTLRNMSTCLVKKQESRIAYNENINAGDLIRVGVDENNNPINLVVITAAHVFSAGIDGDTPQQYTKLWLGELHQ